MRIASGLFDVGHGADVDIVGGSGELGRILAIGDLVVVHRKPVLQLFPGLVGEIGNPAMEVSLPVL